MAEPLNIFRAAGLTGDAVKAVFGPGTDAANAHVHTGRQSLLAGGKAGVDLRLTSLMLHVTTGVSMYSASHPTHLDYAGRSGPGRSIGSEAVEGAIKRWVNLKTKRSGTWSRPNAMAKS